MEDIYQWQYFVFFSQKMQANEVIVAMVSGAVLEYVTQLT